MSNPANMYHAKNKSEAETGYKRCVRNLLARNTAEEILIRMAF